MKGLYDVHCHIIPNVDDGADNMEESIKMLKLEYAEGVRNIIATPHFRFNMFETPLEEIREQYLRLMAAARRIGDGINLYLGCEFHANMEMADMLQSKKVSTMAGSRYVLTEFSGSAEKKYVRERLYSLISHGYRPIVAHVERCAKVRADLNFIEDLVDMGAYMQVNSESIMGKEGFTIKRFCVKLMRADLLHFVGTDCHGSTYRTPKMREAYEYVAKKMGADYAEWLFIQNPESMIK